jgi:hypothetical protein
LPVLAGWGRSRNGLIGCVCDRRTAGAKDKKKKIDRVWIWPVGLIFVLRGLPGVMSDAGTTEKDVSVELATGAVIPSLFLSPQRRRTIILMRTRFTRICMTFTTTRRYSDRCAQLTCRPWLTKTAITTIVLHVRVLRILCHLHRFAHCQHNAG